VTEDDVEHDVNFTAEQGVKLTDLADDYQTVSLRSIFARQKPDAAAKDFATAARTHPLYSQKNVEQISKA
jgi:hypothetical protein